MADDQRVNRMPGDLCQFFGLAAKLKGHTVDHAAGAVGIDANALPLRFVNFRSFFHEVHQPLSLADAHFTHLAAGGDIQFAIGIGDGTEGTQRSQRFRLFRGDQMVIDYQFSHASASLQHFPVAQERIQCLCLDIGIAFNGMLLSQFFRGEDPLHLGCGAG